MLRNHIPVWNLVAAYISYLKVNIFGIIISHQRESFVIQKCAGMYFKTFASIRYDWDKERQCHCKGYAHWMYVELI